MFQWSRGGGGEGLFSISTPKESALILGVFPSGWDCVKVTDGKAIEEIEWESNFFNAESISAIWDSKSCGLLSVGEEIEEEFITRITGDNDGL